VHNFANEAMKWFKDAVIAIKGQGNSSDLNQAEFKTSDNIKFGSVENTDPSHTKAIL